MKLKKMKPQRRKEKQMSFEKHYLVQRLEWGYDVNGNRWEDRMDCLMTAAELIHYIDMSDLINEDYVIYDIADFANPKRIHYAGWQPGLLIEFVDAEGNVVLSGEGTDH